jgi:uncharacterized phage protein gp47/JayE
MAITDPVFQITDNGVTAPTYSEILEYFQDKARQIFGQDINIDSDTADGQLLAIVAVSLHDVNSQAIATAAAFNPQTATGTALDSVVKVNGLTRREPTHSQVDLRIVGQAGTQITNGVAVDSFENRWLLPDSVVIPISGEVTVRAIAEELGAIEAEANSITQIGTPTRGWQTVSNPSAAVVGVAIESDTELQRRQSQSTSREAVSLWEAIVASLYEVDNVTRVSGVHNDTNSTDADGIPAHSIAMVVEGGDVQELADTIWKKKGEGVATYGSLSQTIVDEFENTYTVSFSRPTIKQIAITITISQDYGYTTQKLAVIKQRMADFINALPIGEDVNLIRVLSSAVTGENGVIDTTFKVSAITIGVVGETQAQQPVVIAWNEAAACDVDDITILGV